MPAEDIFNLDNKESILRLLIRQLCTVENSNELTPLYLRDFNLTSISIPKKFNLKNVQLKGQEKAYKEIRDIINADCTFFEEKGFGPNVFTALNEALLNAYQHGNKKNISKKISYGYQLSNSDKRLDLMVEDEGGIINPEFVPFILMHRSKKPVFVDFYTFASKTKPPENQGTGTLFMHQYMDEVFYYKSKKDGLLVHMYKTI